MPSNNDKNVVLVRLRNPTLNIVTPPIGIGYLIKALKTVPDIQPVFIDCKLEDIDETTLIDRLKELDPLVVGFQVFSVDYPRFRDLLEPLKTALPNAVIIAGGPHVSGLPDYTLRTNPQLDFVVKGEGEQALPMLVRALLNGTNEDWHTIPNLVHRRNGQIVHNPVKLIDVNDYGPPDWEALHPERYPAVQHGTFHKSTHVVPILTSRGCPYPCTFCAGHLLTGKTIRLREVQSLTDEIEFLQKSYGFEEFIIEDENFTFYRHHVLSFAAELKKRNIRCYFSLPNGIRLDRVDDEIAQCLAAMGTYVVAYGIESGSRNTLKRMKKGWDLDAIESRVRLMKKHKIKVIGAFILGFHDDTMDDIRQSIEFALRLPIDMAYFANYLPLPGSEDFNLLVESGELKIKEINWNDYNTYWGRIPYHPKQVSADELARAVKTATLRFYLRPRILLGLLKNLTHVVFVKSLLLRISSVFFKRQARRAAC